MRERVPDGLVPDARPRDGLEDVAVERPLQGLRGPVPVAQVPLEPPDVPPLVRDPDRGPDPRRLVADAARVDVAVDRAVPDELPVDRLHDVELAGGGPARAEPQGLAQQPERGPEPLLGARVVAAEAQLGLDARHAAVARRKDVLALDAARGPAVGGAAVAPGDELEGVAARDLEVAGAGCV